MSRLTAIVAALFALSLLPATALAQDVKAGDEKKQETAKKEEEKKKKKNPDVVKYEKAIKDAERFEGEFTLYLRKNAPALGVRSKQTRVAPRHGIALRDDVIFGDPPDHIFVSGQRRARAETRARRIQEDQTGIARRGRARLYLDWLEKQRAFNGLLRHARFLVGYPSPRPLPVAPARLPTTLTYEIQSQS